MLALANISLLPLLPVLLASVSTATAAGVERDYPTQPPPVYTPVEFTNTYPQKICAGEVASVPVDFWYTGGSGHYGVNLGEKHGDQVVDPVEVESDSTATMYLYRTKAWGSYPANTSIQVTVFDYQASPDQAYSFQATGHLPVVQC